MKIEFSLNKIIVYINISTAKILRQCLHTLNKRDLEHCLFCLKKHQKTDKNVTKDCQTLFQR